MAQRLEQLSTYLEARARMQSLQAQAGRPRDYSLALDALKQVICHALLSRGGTEQCALHRSLFEHVQPPTVVSFNYDLIADQTLLRMNRLNWTRFAYSGGNRVEQRSTSGDRRTFELPRTRFEGAISLLKLHGSIHWGERADKSFGLTLAELPAGSLKYGLPPKRPLVVPPVAAKMEIRDSHLRRLWSEAARELREAPGWIIWGYSFPQTDTVTQVLCRTALTRNKKPKPVVVIDPDPMVGDRIKAALRKVRVTPFAGIERFLIENGVTVRPADSRPSRTGSARSARRLGKAASNRPRRGRTGPSRRSARG